MARRRKQVNPFQPLLDRLPTPLRNKYVITLAFFLFIMLFMNRISPFTQWSLQQTKGELEDKKKYYEGKLEAVKRDRVDNERNVEKFAREKYYMKKSGEDVFIIVDEGKERQ